MGKRRLIERMTVKLVEDHTGAQGAYWIPPTAPAYGDIDIDNDGVMGQSWHHAFVVDLSEVASKVLGRQISMNKSVTLHGLQVGIRPVDDAFDNDESAFFAGGIFFHPATAHKMKALSMARKLEKAIEGSEVDADSFFLSTEKDYAGLRYGWNNLNGLSQIRHQTAGWPQGGYYNLDSIFGAYNQMTESCQTNALWGGRAGEAMGTQWIAALASGIGVGDSPPPGGTSADWHSPSLRHEILPLLYGNVVYSSGDEDGAVDDDYIITITVDFTVEE